MRDHRVSTPNEDPLRSSEDVTFLRTLAGSQHEAHDDNVDAIYLSHLSCVVTGYDQYRWTGILLCETWFEVKNPGWPTPDDIERYEDELQDVQAQRGDVILLDPLCRGRNSMFSSTPEMWLPRSYFIRIFGIRLQQIYEESEGLFSRMDTKIKAIVSYT